jgi:hypothetical protein
MIVSRRNAPMIPAASLVDHTSDRLQCGRLTAPDQLEVNFA